MKTWKPDTCKCEIEEIYSGTEITGGGQVITKCLAHKDVADEDLYGVLYANPDGENKMKNQVFRILLGYEEIKDLDIAEEKFEKGKSQGLELKDGIEYDWHFEGEGASRVLKVEVKGTDLTQEKKDQISDLCIEKFGEGKVEII